MLCIYIYILLETLSQLVAGMHRLYFVTSYVMYTSQILVLFSDLVKKKN